MSELREITLQEYMEMVQSEGLLIKSMKGESMYLDSQGSRETPDPEFCTFTQTISTIDEDRFKDVLNPRGCNLANFKSNPLFLYEHGIGPNGPLTNPNAILGRINSVSMYDDKITAESMYVPSKQNPLPGQMLELERKGLIPGNSIGWRPLAGIKITPDGKRYVDKWELLEVSKVLVPVNGKATNRQFGR